MNKFDTQRDKLFWEEIEKIKPPLGNVLEEIENLKVMLNELLDAKKNRHNTRMNTVDKKKPTTPDHKTKLKLKGANAKDNYTTNNPRTKPNKLGLSMDIIHDPKKPKKAGTERKEINLKTVPLNESEKEEKAKELKEKKEKEKEELRKKKEKEKKEQEEKTKRRY